MDGVGVAAPGPGNAVTLANTPNLDAYWPLNPHGFIEASGLYVGLPEGTDGNSEVGHMTMGAGKIILQDLPRIDNSIKNRTFFENPVLKQAFEHAKKNKSDVHLMGLIGNGHVHASLEHLFELIKMAHNEKMDPDKVFIHAFTDGRDSSPNSALDIFEKLELFCIQKSMGRIASFIGRAYSMDRNKNWARIKKAYDMLTSANGKVITDWRAEIQASYKKKIFDEYLEPTLIVEKNNPSPVQIKQNDAVIFFNYRPDRAQQLTRAFEDENFPGWERPLISNLYFTGFTDYKSGFPKRIAFRQESVTNPLGKILSDNGYTQLRIAESEKFPHVTYFFNGGNGSVFNNEKWIEIPSPKDVATYDQKPEMSMEWVTTTLIEKIKSKEYDFYLVNFAAPDMVAHTGLIPPTIKAMEITDKCIGQIVDTTLEQDGAVIITADHGNAEEMINPQTGEADTKHSVNQVPIMIVKKGLGDIELPVGSLADIAPTILGLLNIKIPPEMTGRNLLG